MKAIYGLGAIRMLMAEPNPQIRSSLRSSLFRYDLRGIDDATSASHTHEILGNKHYDLVVIDADMDDRNILESIRHVRENKLGRDPFVNIILVADPPHTERARQLVSAGADAILIRPLSVQVLHSKITQLIESRRPFTITHDYIGPEKRTEPRQSNMPTAIVAVPSNLLSRAYGKTDDELHFKSVAETWGIVRRHRVNCLIFQLHWMASHMKSGREKEFAESLLARLVKQLSAVAEMLVHWVGDEKNEEFYLACRRLHEDAERLSHIQGKPDAQLIEAINSDVNKLEELWKTGSLKADTPAAAT